MSYFLKQIQADLFEIAYDLTGLTLSDRFNPYKKLFEDSIVHRSNINVDVQKNIQGLNDKYLIHAQYKKSDLFQFLVKRFNNRTLRSHAPESELHQSCLQFVISLAQKPLEVKLDEFSDLVHEQIEEANFDWTAYLLGDQRQETIVPFDSDEDDNTDGDDKADSTVVLNEIDSTQLEIERKTIDDVEQQSCTLLDRELITSYWHRLSSDDVSPALRNFALFWDQTMMKMTHLAYRVTAQTLTEYILIRETLWLLMDSTQLHVYTIDADGHAHVADFVRLCDAAPITIQECLAHFTSISNQLRLAWRFLAKMNQTSNRCCRTLSAFAQALQQQMNIIRLQLADIEHQCLEQNCTYTILSLHRELDSLGIIAKSQSIERLFDQASFLHTRQETEANCDLTLELIHILYKNVLTAEMLNISKILDFLLPLFVASCRIYLDIIQTWLIRGTLFDPYNEFFIKRKTDVSVESIDFWHLAYTEQVQNAALIPTWLATVVPALVKAGKCAELLRFNGVLLKETDENLLFIEQFSQDLQEKLDLKQISRSPLDCLHRDHAGQSTMPFISLKLAFDDIDDEKNAFLALAFDRMRMPKTSLIEIPRDQLSVVPCEDRSTSIDSVLRDFSQRVLLARCNHLIQQLTHDILDRQHYLTHIQYLRDFFLFENGSFMHQFALRLYAKLSMIIHERLDAFTVLVAFDSTLTMFGLEKTNYPIGVTFQSSSSTSESSLAQKYLIQNVQLRYELPRELSIIIKPEQMEIYQKCFAFVLQVKQAKYALDQLLFIEFRVKTRLRNRRLYRHQSYHLHHEMFLLRARLLHAVNAVNDFVLTTFHTAGEQFLAKHGNSSVDIESMIAYHEKFLTALAIGSLLQPKQQAIRDQLIKLFEIVAIFARRWQLGFDSIKIEQIVKLKTEFNQTKQFISTVLKPFLPRMVESPLRALACALQDNFYTNN